jgi:hypothetical protein
MWSPHRLTLREVRAPLVTSSIQFHSLLSNKSMTLTKLKKVKNPKLQQTMSHNPWLNSHPPRNRAWKPRQKQKSRLKQRLKRCQPSFKWERRWWATGAPNEWNGEEVII